MADGDRIVAGRGAHRGHTVTIETIINGRVEYYVGCSCGVSGYGIDRPGANCKHWHGHLAEYAEKKEDDSQSSN